MTTQSTKEQWIYIPIQNHTNLVDVFDNSGLHVGEMFDTHAMKVTHCVNTHAALVEAMEHALITMDTQILEDSSEMIDESKSKLRSALQLARGEQ